MENKNLVLIIGVLIVNMFLAGTAMAICPVDLDYFGYECKEYSGGTNYEWYNITSNTSLYSGQISKPWKDLLNSSDDQNASFDLTPYSFTYYGIEYKTIHISNNGLIFFSSGDSKILNKEIVPHRTKNIHNFIAPFWDDLTTIGAGAQDSAGSVYADIATDQIVPAGWERLIIEWDNNEHYTLSDKGISFEAILGIGANNKGNIKFVYNNSPDYCCRFGNVTHPYPEDGPFFNNGSSATVGIEGLDTNKTNNIGIQYSYNENIIKPGLVVEFKLIEKKANLTLSKRGPTYMGQGKPITYTLSYSNTGNYAIDVDLTDTLDPKVENASWPSGPSPTPIKIGNNIIKWTGINLQPNIGNTSLLNVSIRKNIPKGEVIINKAYIKDTSSPLNATFELPTIVNDLDFPEGVDISPAFGSKSGKPVVFWGHTLKFNFTSPCNASIALMNVSVRNNSNNPPTDEFYSYNMTAVIRDANGFAKLWNYTQNKTFSSMGLHGSAEIIFAYSGGECGSGNSIGTKVDIYIDPAGYIYDVDTGDRIQNATVWLQRPDGLGRGGWENVPVVFPPNRSFMLPNKNPLISTEAGQYQWDTLKGIYRVNVSAPGYYPADSIVIVVPPPVFDLNVGLKSKNKTGSMGFNIVVEPVNNTAKKGRTAAFSVTLTALRTLQEEEFIELSVVDLVGNPITWNNRFSENTIKIGPYSDESRRIRTVSLDIDIPTDTSEGEYFQKIKANGYLQNISNPAIPDRFSGSVESKEFPISIKVIPGFTMISFSVIIIVGLMLSYKRRKVK